VYLIKKDRRTFMTLTEAELNYPWEGVIFVAVDKETDIIYMSKRYRDEHGNIQSIILSTESAMEAFGPLDGVKTGEDDNPNAPTEDVKVGRLGASLKRTQPKSTFTKIMDICQLDWKVVRSLQMGLPY
jgi:hypothetical protein